MAKAGIRLMVGLGNPGDEYKDTRHNAGWWLMDEVVGSHTPMKFEKKFFGYTAKQRIAGQDCWFLKPATFMNKSGQSVLALAQYYKIQPEEILVLHDELDLAVGQVKLKLGGGHAGHNGLRDIMLRLNSNGFWRLRLGIERPDYKGPVANYVLGRMPADKRDALMQTAQPFYAVLDLLVTGEFPRAMNELHSQR